MPPLLLRRRAEALRERMDDPDCDRALLDATYAQFGAVNRLVAGWTALLRGRLEPRLERVALREGRPARVLDLGSGGGDLVRRLAGRARARGLPLEVVGADPDPRAHAWAAARGAPPGARFTAVGSAELRAAGERFDAVVSNHVLHHLAPDELRAFLDDAAALAPDGLNLHSDLRRSDLAWLAFHAFRPVFRRSFIVEDGLRSIRRAWRPAELRARLRDWEGEGALAPGWRVERAEPFRTLAVRDGGADAGADGGDPA